MTVDEAFKNIENVVIQISDTYIRHMEIEVKFIQEKAKLSLWIVGLSIGLELFVLNKIEAADLANCFSVVLFSFVSFLFLWNSFLGLLTRLKQTRLVNHLWTIETYYDYQKSQILLNLNQDSELGKQLLNDFKDGTALDNIKDIVYIGEKEAKNDKEREEDRAFLLKSEDRPTTLLVLQAILTVILYVYLLF